MRTKRLSFLLCLVLVSAVAAPANAATATRTTPGNDIGLARAAVGIAR